MSIIRQLKSEGVLKGYWNFRAGHVNDLSGNSNNGTITSSVFNKRGLQPIGTTGDKIILSDITGNYAIKHDI